MLGELQRNLVFISTPLFMDYIFVFLYSKLLITWFYLSSKFDNFDTIPTFSTVQKPLACTVQKKNKRMRPYDRGCKLLSSAITVDKFQHCEDNCS